jgi:hypothetical protein
MGSVVRLKVDWVSVGLRELEIAGKRAKVWIRFEHHDDKRRLERRRWDIQGCIQRECGIKAAKGFTKKFSRSGEWFMVRMKPEGAREFAKDLMPHIRRGSIEVWFDDNQVEAKPLERRRA